MDKPYASYFVTIDGNVKRLSDADEYIREHNILPDYLDTYEETDEGIMYSIEQGSMPKGDGVDDVFAKLAKAFPDLEITIDEACEEPSFPSRTLMFKNGRLEKTLWGRTLEPEQYDRTTIDAIISALRAANMTEAADYISNMGLA